ncbi:MAG TPA: NlpC/P60 family protein [Streptosporangiaceae bacterium]|nr:NlpC/P60 family protein [Streptosporangiaceae bacterium]
MGATAPRAGSLFSIRVIIGVLLAVGGLLVASAPPAGADPEPSITELKAEADKLNNRLEVLTEQYNGLRVRLAHAQSAARAAEQAAGEQRLALRQVQDRVRELAARTYMSGGVDQATAAFAAAPDPQAFLDQASAIGYFARQDGDRIKELAAATEAADRATKAKDTKVNEVRALTDQIGGKKRRIESLLAENKDKLAAAVKAERAEEAKRLAAAARQRAAANAAPSTGTGGSVGASTKALRAVAAAKSKLGAPYVWGGSGPSTFDCSGLTMWAYKQVGISLPHFTGAQWNAGRHVSRSALRPGDLVFFYSDLHHMGMYVGAGKMIHAPRTGDVVRIATLDGRPYAGAVRVT